MKLTCLVLMLVLSIHIFGQQTTPVVNTDYLKKSKSQKTIAWVLVGGGSVLTTIGLGVALSGGLDCAFGDPNCDRNQTLANILAISGSAAILGSIPLFIASGKNRKRAAASVSLKMESATTIYQLAVFSNRYPALAILVRL